MNDPQVITLVYDGEENRCSVDIGTIDPMIAAGWLAAAAEEVESRAVWPTFVILANGVEQAVEEEAEE